ncbi:ATP-binding protein [Frigoribacterium sp. CFBP9030]|uniref:ATP-binding protein n=1 Tax=Frigoribacterium sp. CFBP9030 TaxID=3096537 RepID=UPI002A69D270|nr:ATP-binding protein [Frigoribacterium sp. CFBP9030]MDY0892924.1 ATP-binding protein [Frigoribacterium sp. CFBP9030]
MTLNPYTPGAGTRPPTLIGRESQLAVVGSLAELVEAGRSSNPVVFTGLRGVGKTSLLQEVGAVLRSRGWLAGYYEVRRDVEPGVAVRSIVRDSADLTQGRLRKALSSGAHSIGGMKLSLGPTGFTFAVDAAAPRREDSDPFPELVRFLRLLGRDASQNGVGVALLIDELQVFRKRDIAVLVQALSALKDEPIVLIGAGLPYLASELSKANTYAERFRFEVIDRLGEADARSAVTDPAFDLGTIWDDDALERVLELADRYPYFLQLYASESWTSAAGAARIDSTHVDEAIPAVQRQLDAGLYSARYDRLSEREREYVDTMVAVADASPDGGDDARPRPSVSPRVQSGAVAAELGKSLTQVATTRDRIIRKGIIHAPVYGELEFSVPGFADYVRRRTGRAR